MQLVQGNEWRKDFKNWTQMECGGTCLQSEQSENSMEN